MMTEAKAQPPNTLYIEVTGAGIPEVDGLFVPSTVPPTESESGTLSTVGYWNGKLAWDRADGKCERRPSLSYSNTYKSWRIARLDGHLAYHVTCDDELPPTDREWDVYHKGVAPAPKIAIHHVDPRQPCPSPNVVFVLGGPGAGKGTMCELAEGQLQWSHLSTGELLRSEQDLGGPLADVIAEQISAGQLVSDQVVVELLKTSMERVMRSTGKRNFLLDGFPRSQGNIAEWKRVFGTTDLPKMLYFECPLEILEQRILGRAKYTGRTDDNIESLRKRFHTFQVETLPTVDYFRKLDRCVQIDTGRDRQAVYDDVVTALSGFTDAAVVARPLTERAEMLLGLRPFPNED